MKVSVVCPIYNEERFIARCIESVVAQDYPKEELELFFVDGMSNDATRSIVADYASKYPFLHLLDNPHKTVPYALNAGIKDSTGDIIIRIDGHCTYPVNYISTLVEWQVKLQADNVGAVWNTLPARDTTVCHAIAAASSHKFGVGNSLHKVGADKVTETDTVPFGCFPRSVFERIGLFDTDLVRNQDDEFNARIINAGGKIFLIPKLVIDYYARDSVKKMMKMYYQYGLFKPLVNKKLGAPATVRQFFPMLFVLGIVLGGLMSLAWSWPQIPYLAVLLLYALLAVAFSVQEAGRRHKPLLVLVLPLMFLLVHLSYGWGYLVGIYKLLTHGKFAVEINR
ncbi:MAG: glycosyltransferase family 2 protein [Bacteroidaceae bacterium]|nr:glycosyltransferase family 2 protein [Bacteroidaceae bacterium]